MNNKANSDAIPKVYQSRRPEKTVLYKVLQENLNTWIEQTHKNGNSIPPHIEKDFRQYLECGLLSYGFARARCECGHEFLVAFSCTKSRLYEEKDVAFVHLAILAIWLKRQHI